MIDAIEPLRAQEMIGLGNMIVVAVAAGVAMAGMAGSKTAAETAIGRFNQWLAGQRALVDGTVGYDVDEHGVPLLHSAADIRRWFQEKGNIRV